MKKITLCFSILMAVNIFHITSFIINQNNNKKINRRNGTNYYMNKQVNKPEYPYNEKNNKSNKTTFTTDPLFYSYNEDKFKEAQQKSKEMEKTIYTNNLTKHQKQPELINELSKKERELLEYIIKSNEKEQEIQKRIENTEKIIQKQQELIEGAEDLKKDWNKILEDVKTLI